MSHLARPCLRDRWLLLACLLPAVACSSGNGPIAPFGGGNLLYVVNGGANTITAYQTGVNGNVAPTVTIGSLTRLSYPTGIARDSAGNFYVANYLSNSITVYAAGVSGNAAPTGIVLGSSTGLSYPVGIALDRLNHLYVANAGNNSITVYGAGAGGNATPTTTVTGSNTGLHRPVGIALGAGGTLYVANAGDSSITVYAAGANGNATPTLRIAGSNTGLIGVQGIARDTAGKIYVTNNGGSGGNFVTVYAAGASGNVAPTATIAGTSTGLNLPVGIAVDAAGKIYVANGGSGVGSSITIYAAGASGNAAPLATIAGSNTGLRGPNGLTLDATGDVYVTNYGFNGDYYTVTVYAAGASGDATPTTMIGVSNGTGLSYPFGIARDAAGNHYVTNPGPNTVTEYAAGASGNAAPMATIVVVAYSGNQSGYPAGVTTDVAGSLYVTTTQHRSAGTGIYPTILVFAPGASAGATPTRTITGTNTGMNGPYGVARDAAGNLYVVNDGSSCCGAGNTITVYAAGASGNAAPMATIVGNLTGLNVPSGITVDVAGHLYVSNKGGNSLTIYSAGATGNVAPTAMIVGSNTGLSGPIGIALDAAGRMYVANSTANSITVYAAGAIGNATPVATISGSNTGLSSPLGISF